MSDLDRYLDDFGRTLERATTAPPARRRTPRRVAAAGLATALAGALVAVLALPGAPERLDPVAEARAALAAPADTILHTVVVQEHHRGRGNERTRPAGGGAASARVELWSTEARWRAVSTSDRFPTAEIAYADGVQRFYVRSTNRLSILRDAGVGRRMNTPGTTTLGRDPVITLRELLSQGKLRDAGLATVAGREVRRLVGAERYRLQAGTVVVQAEYHVDPQTSAPITVRIESRPAGSRQWTTFTSRFEVYERLPVNTATARLLRIDTKPDPQVLVQRAGG